MPDKRTNILVLLQPRIIFFVATKTMERLDRISIPYWAYILTNTLASVYVNPNTFATSIKNAQHAPKISEIMYIRIFTNSRLNKICTQKV